MEINIEGQRLYFPYSHILKQQMHILKNLQLAVSNRKSLIAQSSLNNRKRAIISSFIINQMLSNSSFKKVIYVCNHKKQIRNFKTIFKEVQKAYPKLFYEDTDVKIKIQAEIKDLPQQKQDIDQVQQKDVSNIDQVENQPISPVKQQQNFMFFLENDPDVKQVMEKQQKQQKKIRQEQQKKQKIVQKQKKLTSRLQIDQSSSEKKQSIYDQEIKIIRLTSATTFIKQAIQNTTDIKSTNLIIFQSSSFDEMFQQSLTYEFNQIIIRRAYLQLEKVQSYLSEQQQNWSFKQSIKKVDKTFNLFRQQIVSKKKIRVNQDQIVSQQILLNLCILKYIIVFFQAKQFAVERKKQLPISKSSQDFLDQIWNKLLISDKIMLRSFKYLQMIQNITGKKCKNTKIICQFLQNLHSFHNYFNKNHKDAFRVFVKARTSQNLFQIKLKCQDPSIVIQTLLKKCHSLVILQNFIYPKEVTKHILNKFSSHFKIQHSEQSLVNRQLLLALNITSTPSQDDLTTKTKPQDLQVYGNIVRAYGVFLCDICQQTPDGIIAVFPSLQLISEFKIQWQKKEGIFDKLSHVKKVFEQSQYQLQNIKNIIKYQKYCDIGRGSIFLISARGKMSLYQKLMGHYSKVIVFIGYPGPQNEIQFKQQMNFFNFGMTQKNILDDTLKHTSKCLSNCIDCSMDQKCIIFTDVGFNDPLIKKWYPFLKKGNLSTAQGLQQLREFFRRDKKQMLNIVQSQIYKETQQNLKQKENQIKVQQKSEKI